MFRYRRAEKTDIFDWLVIFSVINIVVQLQRNREVEKINIFDWLVIFIVSPTFGCLFSDCQSNVSRK